ncbi:hypothetical protein [Undibacterium oligocarboniphilum]|uniref:Uncharacterized protein n=1 Tax=Undibacterium oligocarboniphilum TaxID=666702 RepID=A0A850QIR3_9BURK|nr:hypothetical protein [Undibacterium oligocarboniphilum]MBC3871883.1 hypothetical protein [Undibacterium oligocarboniphilum]NVO79471.1 hypothetical protein [Undibacterium oligocarboniphilum]
MKHLFRALVSGAILATSLSAVAGPDFQMLELARKARALRLSHQATTLVNQPVSSSNPVQTEVDAKEKQMMKDCNEMKKKSKN